MNGAAVPALLFFPDSLHRWLVFGGAGLVLGFFAFAFGLGARGLLRSLDPLPRLLCAAAAILVLAAGVWLMWRLWVWGTVRLDAEGITASGFLCERRVEWAQLKSVSLGQRSGVIRDPSGHLERQTIVHLELETQGGRSLILHSWRYPSGNLWDLLLLLGRDREEGRRRLDAMLRESGAHPHRGFPWRWALAVAAVLLGLWAVRRIRIHMAYAAMEAHARTVLPVEKE